MAGARRSGGASKGQSCSTKGSGGWGEKHHDGKRGPDPGPRREAGRTHGQDGGLANGGQCCGGIWWRSCCAPAGVSS